MDIGEKIFELRKQKNLSQEALAEKVGVARQTISKWELGETTPDIKQAKELSNIFQVSLDELTGNDVKEVIIEKVSNTEKLAGMVIKILKVLGVLLIASILLTITSFIGFTGIRSKTVIEIENEKSIMQMEETLGDKKCIIEVGSDGTFSCEGVSPEIEEEILELVDFDDFEETEEKITKYFIRLNNEIKDGE